MPFVGAVIVPHSPLLLPTVGKEFQTQTKRTRKALAAALHELYALSPDGLIVIHPHGRPAPGSFGLNIADEYLATFAEFGDLVTELKLRGDTQLASLIAERAEDAGFPVKQVHIPKIAYDAAIPLLGLDAAARIPIIPITPSDLDIQAHVDMGRVLSDVLHTTRRRIAVVNSAELSQHAAATAPGGFRPAGEHFDTTVVKSLTKTKLASHLIAVPSETIEQAEACGWLPILMLSGLIAKTNCHVRKLSYEHPFGIGLLVATVHPA